MATCICFIPTCHQRYESTDPDDMEGFGRCDKCKANLINVMNKTAAILAQKTPREVTSAMDNYDIVEVPNKHGGFDKQFVPKRGTRADQIMRFAQGKDRIL